MLKNHYTIIIGEVHEKDGSLATKSLTVKSYNRCRARNTARKQCYIPIQRGMFCEDHWYDQVNIRPFREDFGFTLEYIPPYVIIEKPQNIHEEHLGKIIADYLIENVNYPDALATHTKAMNIARQAFESNI